MTQNFRSQIFDTFDTFFVTWRGLLNLGPIMAFLMYCYEIWPREAKTRGDYMVLLPKLSTARIYKTSQPLNFAISQICDCESQFHIIKTSQTQICSQINWNRSASLRVTMRLRNRKYVRVQNCQIHPKLRSILCITQTMTCHENIVVLRPNHSCLYSIVRYIIAECEILIFLCQLAVKNALLRANSSNKSAIKDKVTC